MKPLALLPLAIALGACGDASSSSNNTTRAAGIQADTPGRGSIATLGSAPSEEAVKAWINESVQGFVNGSSSEPQAISLDFQSVEIEPAQTVTNDQVVAGVRNDTYYPVTVHYTENDTYGADVQSKQVAYRYWFYVDQSGNWNAAKVGPV